METMRSSWLMLTAPNSQASTHQPQPLQTSLSTSMMPVVSLTLMHSRGQAYMQVGSSHRRQAMAMMAAGCRRTRRISDSSGL